MEVTDYPLQFFVKPRLLEFSRTVTVLSLSLIFTLLFRCFTFCSDIQSFYLEVNNRDRFLNVITAPLV